MDMLIRKEDVWPSLLPNSHYTSLYVEEPHMWIGIEKDTGYEIALLHNALNAGAEVPSYTLRSSGADVYNHLVDVCGAVTPTTIHSYLQSLMFVAAPPYGYEPLPLNDKVTAHLSIRPGVRCYSPFALVLLKPIQRIPDRWTMNHCKRALANGQFRHLKCDRYYIDDYACRDVNYHPPAPVPLELLKKIVHSPQGWRTSLEPDTGYVTISLQQLYCYSFMLDFTSHAKLEVRPEIRIAG